MSYLLEAVTSTAADLGANKILAINLVVGERTSLVDDAMTFCWDMLAHDTLAEGATLNIRRTRMTFHCAGCATDYPPEGANFDCPSCQAIGQMNDDGNELLIESIEIRS
jgi:hydrogenase nickel incorporation protein HypA/HybF